MSPHGTKLTAARGIPDADDAEWRVELHRDVEKSIIQFGLKNPDFKPTLIMLFSELKHDPKQFPKKNGALKSARAAPVRYRGREAWRAVFRLDERTRQVFVLALAPHDEAYEVATRRVALRVVR